MAAAKTRKSLIAKSLFCVAVLIFLLFPTAILHLYNFDLDNIHELQSPDPGSHSNAQTHTTLDMTALKHMKLSAASAYGLTPQELWKLYNLPGLNGGEGQLIAEVIDGSIPSMESDLNAYSQRFGLPACTVASGCLTIQNQGGRYIPKGADPAEGILDVEIMHAIAPKAKILLYIMSSDNTSIARGPADIIKKPGLRSINMSYGFEGNGKRFANLYNNNPNHVALFAASGDDGYGKITPPSIYPGVIAVGGTIVNGTTEIGWSGSGGGLSKLYPEPAYQQSYGIPQANGHRGNPDVAAVSGTPIAIYEMGRWRGERGTSVASPIWTGIAALVNKPITNELLYGLAKAKPDSFGDITSGANGKCGFYCTAHPGYDYVTGLGTPKNFVANVNAMSTAQAMALKP
ncbi:S53 family peptidase [Dictyobacter alpinus]|nr:S53 family peptidase [Dictyobacter alpinus]